MATLRMALQAARDLGPGPLARYAAYQAKLGSGWLRRRTPAYEWDARPLKAWLDAGVPAAPAEYAVFRQARQRPRFFFRLDAGRVLALSSALTGAQAAAVSEAEDIRRGRFRLFGSPPVDLGFPPDWRAFVSPDGRAARVDSDRHWTAYPDNAWPDDVKYLWEMSRFGWVYPLARAYCLTADDRYAEAFWSLVVAWREANRPNLGPHWVSAQEVALRMMALVFGMAAFGPRLGQFPARVAELAAMIGAHAERIPPTLEYALAQNNNHLLTEAVGLYTAGLLFPEFRQAERWRRMGRGWLVRGLLRQTFPDGGYIQHSANYHRLALQAGLWAASLAQANDEPLPAEALAALGRSTVCLAALVDPESGRAPNFGPNDGAHILPLSALPFEDYRPTLQAASVAFLGRRLLAAGPWDESCAWLGIEIPVGAEVETPRGDSFPQAGLQFLRGQSDWAVLRCARFTSRPGHSDQLHLDLWRHGLGIAGDPGTYSYNASPPWDNALSGAGVHNTVVLDGQEPMRRGGRFLWLNWAQGRVLGRWRSAGGRLEVVAAAHDGYRRLGVTHRRTACRLGDGLWLVIDDLLGQGRHTASLGWLLPDWPWRLEGSSLRLEGDNGPVTVTLEAAGARLGLYRAGERAAGEALTGAAPTWGWMSPTYGVRQPALRLAAETEGNLPLRLTTRFLLGGAAPDALRFEVREPRLGPSAIAWVEFGGERLDA